jgi:hypothetical protein
MNLLAGKLGAFLNPWKRAFWSPLESQEPFRMLPRDALSSFVV